MHPNLKLCNRETLVPDLDVLGLFGLIFNEFWKGVVFGRVVGFFCGGCFDVVYRWYF